MGRYVFWGGIIVFSSFFAGVKREFSGYNAAKLVKDILAGLTVCAVALPLALAFGVSSGASAAAGLVTAIVAGIVIALLGGASFQISGPTGAMSAVLVGIVAAHGLQGVFFACFAAGVLLLIAGVLRLGRLISFIPMPVIMGFTSGIAIIIALGQIDNFFGTTSEGLTNIEKLLSYGRLGFHVNWQAALIGLLVVAVMVVWPKKSGRARPRLARRHHRSRHRRGRVPYGFSRHRRRHSPHAAARRPAGSFVAQLLDGQRPALAHRDDRGARHDRKPSVRRFRLAHEG